MNRSQFVNCGRLRSLRPVLLEWICLNYRYGEMASWQENAWWCNERASTGVLAGAVWSKGGVALEEYATQKVSKKKLTTGRCDLFIDTGSARFACEIKQRFTSLGRGWRGDISDVRAAFDMACEDARKLLPNEGRRLAICFITPSFPAAESRYADACLDDWIVKMQSLDWDAIAWCFPEKAWRLRWKNGRVYPGVVILIREVFKGVRQR